jgi:hypothetical protein
MPRQAAVLQMIVSVVEAKIHHMLQLNLPQGKPLRRDAKPISIFVNARAKDASNGGAINIAITACLPDDRS